MRLVRLVLALVIFGAAGPAVAGPFEDAEAAYQKGDYATALRLWRPLAEQGNSRAQANLGYMFSIGRGVPQDYVQAHKWFSLSAAQGNAVATRNRDSIAAKMKAAQIAEAQKLAREWKPQPVR